MAKAQKVIIHGIPYESKSAACKAFGHALSKINHRINRGMTLEQAVTGIDRFQGKKLHPSYSHWNAMRSRCYSVSSCSKRYKAKGIEMCEAWKNDFWAFAEDMGTPPSKDVSIDRIDNQGNYSPENCRWATRKEQQRNMGSNVKITVFDETKVLAEWAEISGLRADTISNRMHRGEPPELAVTMPTREGRKSMITLDMNSLLYLRIQAEQATQEVA